MGFENPNDAEEFYASPEQIELTYQRLTRALKAGVAFAIVAIVSADCDPAGLLAADRRRRLPFSKR